MSEDKSPIEKAVELVVYAPIGFANFIRTMLPGWIEGGRQEVTKQVTTAKALSELAISQAKTQTEGVVSNLASRRAAPPAPSPSPRPPVMASAPAPPVSAPSSNGPRPSDDDLAIPGYDSLAASQVVQRLGGLSREELEAVRTYEEATRGRRTILNKVSQLQAEESA